jgi:preprotein translocase subunit SecA
MAGRGTDIVLGGSIQREISQIEENAGLSDAQKQSAIEKLREEWLVVHNQVVEAGGLHIIGSERHESRRIDNQLRGRSGRQGDAGSSRFYLCLEDPLLRIFAGDRVAMVMDRLKMPEGEPIEAGMVSRAIESAQRKVEGRNFDIRKQLLEYDDVSNEQRKAIYAQRNEIVETTDISETIEAMCNSVVAAKMAEYIPPQSMEEEWDVPGLEKALAAFNLNVPVGDWLKAEPTLAEEDILEKVQAEAKALYQSKVAQVGEETMRQFEHAVMLQHLDHHWREHLSALDHLRQGIHLRGYAQKNPKQEYKREAFELFAGLLDRIKHDVAQIILTVQIQSQEEVEAMESAMQTQRAMEYSHADDEDTGAVDKTRFKAKHKVGRNDPCPCGSGKKYKHCHGKLTS